MTEIRRVRTDEWRLLRDMRLRALGDAPRAFSTTLAEASARPEKTWREAAARGGAGERWVTFVADRDGELVGMATGHVADESERASTDPPFAHLMQMWVDPRARREGVGRRLALAVIGWARGRVPVVRLNAVESERAAIALYESVGFRDTGRRDRVAADRDDLEMEMERPTTDG